MVEKDLELEFDIQCIKNAFATCTCLYNDTKVKLSDFDKKYSSRKDFVIIQFRNIFFNYLKY